MSDPKQSGFGSSYLRHPEGYNHFENTPGQVRPVSAFEPWFSPSNHSSPPVSPRPHSMVSEASAGRSFTPDFHSNNTIIVPGMNGETVAKFMDFFERSAAADGGVLLGVKAKEIFQKSMVPNSTLGLIWTLCDREQRGFLSVGEFVVAMHLIECVMKGTLVTLPNKVPSYFFEAPFQSGVGDQDTSQHHNTLEHNPYRTSAVARETSISTASPGNIPLHDLMVDQRIALRTKTLRDIQAAESILAALQNLDNADCASKNASLAKLGEQLKVEDGKLRAIHEDIQHKNLILAGFKGVDPLDTVKAWQLRRHQEQLGGLQDEVAQQERLTSNLKQQLERQRLDLQDFESKIQASRATLGGTNVETNFVPAAVENSAKTPTYETSAVDRPEGRHVGNFESSAAATNRSSYGR